MEEKKPQLRPYAYHIGVYVILLIGIHSTYHFITEMSFYTQLNNKLKNAIQAYNEKDFFTAIDWYNQVLLEASLTDKNQKRLALAYCACKTESNVEKGIDLLSQLFRSKKYTKQEFYDLKKEFLEVTQQNLEIYFTYGKMA